jgi:hypothetical protein
MKCVNRVARFGEGGAHARQEQEWRAFWVMFCQAAPQDPARPRLGEATLPEVGDRLDHALRQQLSYLSAIVGMSEFDGPDFTRAPSRPALPRQRRKPRRLAEGGRANVELLPSKGIAGGRAQIGDGGGWLVDGGQGLAR